MKNKGYLFFCSILLLAGCKYLKINHDANTEEPLARVNEVYLYKSDVFSQYPGNLSSDDSIFWIKNIVNNWVRHQILLHQAEKNLTEEQKDFSKQLTEYRNSLLVYEYENRLLAKELDTIVYPQEIEAYYTDNLDNFKLKRNIVKAIYFSVNALDTKCLKEATKIFKTTPINFQRLEYLCSEYQSHVCSFDTSSWVYFDDIQSVVPIKTYNEESFLRYNRNVDFRDGNQWYFLCFYDFRLKEELVPLELEAENIQRIILNLRKTELMRNIRKQMYQDAELAGDIEIY